MSTIVRSPESLAAQPKSIETISLNGYLACQECVELGAYRRMPKEAKMTGFGKLYGPTAVITGAAGGIGAGFARVLGSRGFDLVLTDINADGLQRTADDLSAQHSHAVSTVVLDMTDPTAPQSLADFSSEHDIGLVIVN